MPTPRKANPKPAGRHSKYTKELAETICRELANGHSLRRICRRRGMPDKETVRAWLNSRPAFLAQYKRAREDQADSLMEEALDATRRAKDTAAAACASVRLNAIKWAAGKLKPKVYGDKTTVEHAGSVATKVTHDVRPSLARMMNDPVAWRQAKSLAYAAGTKPTTGGTEPNKY